MMRNLAVLPKNPRRNLERIKGQDWRVPTPPPAMEGGMVHSHDSLPMFSRIVEPSKRTPPL
jgi:hypothetical protein